MDNELSEKISEFIEITGKCLLFSSLSLANGIRVFYFSCFSSKRGKVIPEAALVAGYASVSGFSAVQTAPSP